jgi:hypothetical protein
MTHETTLDPTDTLKSLAALLSPGLLERALSQLLADQLRAAAPTLAAQPTLTPIPGSLPLPEAAAVWVTPPEAARRTGVPVKTIRGYIADGRIEVRLRNVAANPKAPKYLVNINEVTRVATVPTRKSHPESRMVTVARAAHPRPDEWARARIAPADAR